MTTFHDRDQETGLDYRGARYYDSDIARFLSIDPWQAKYPSWSTYNYVMANPIAFTDPSGKGVEGDYYDKKGKYLGSDGKDDNKVYTIAKPKYETIYGESSSGESVALGRQLLFTGAKLKGTVDNTTLSFIGAADAADPKRADGTITITQHVGNKSFTRLSVAAIGGPWGNGSPENGDYLLNNYAERGPESGWSNPGMTREGIGFSLNMEPLFKTGRTLLRVHPDGGQVEGTQGCIGIVGGAAELNNFKSAVKSALKFESSLKLNVNIQNNPNNNGYGKKVISNGE